MDWIIGTNGNLIRVWSFDTRELDGAIYSSDLAKFHRTMGDCLFGC